MVAVADSFQTAIKLYVSLKQGKSDKERRAVWFVRESKKEPVIYRFLLLHYYISKSLVLTQIKRHSTNHTYSKIVYYYLCFSLRHDSCRGSKPESRTPWFEIQLGDYFTNDFGFVISGLPVRFRQMGFSLSSVRRL